MIVAARERNGRSIGLILLPLFWAVRKATGDARVEGDAETLVSVVHICHQATSPGQ